MIRGAREAGQILDRPFHGGLWKFHYQRNPISANSTSATHLLLHIQAALLQRGSGETAPRGALGRAVAKVPFTEGHRMEIDWLVMQAAADQPRYFHQAKHAGQFMAGLAQESAKGIQPGSRPA